ncbi:hypothetical protein [Spirosoma sp.]|uniref:hypothetical protein n=1 Tax=Spirosoma sp. TaxID=1899569 RepID=UPI00262B956B|nr:hypothetical protein [Spirosoma sp.]MCX6217869.1 hypothetical protein [Spirosoma sp.]
MPSSAYSLPAVFALLVLLVAMCTMLYQRDVLPADAAKDSQPVIRFELARTPADIRALFTDAPQKPRIAFVDKMRFLTRLDFLFILFYTLFTFLFSWKAIQADPTVPNRFVLVLAVAVGLFDVLENIQLLGILAKVEQNTMDTFQPELPRLSVFTWVKWELTGLLMVLIAPFLWKGDSWSKGLAVFFLIVFLFGLLALEERLSDREGIDQAAHFTGLVLLAFGAFALYVIGKTLVYRFGRHRPIPTS